MKKPVVGIVPLVDIERESLWMLPGYMEGVRQAGGLPIMLPLTDGPEDLDNLLSLCDGFLFTGGQDAGPDLYGQEALPLCGPLCPERDRMEPPLLRRAIEADKAVLGICRGLQLINAALGGTLYQDLPVQRPSGCDHHMAAPYHREAHRVAIAPGSPMDSLFPGGELAVNSCHHQGIRDLSPQLSAMCTAPDGLVEAVWMPEKRFLWAVQWHPEFWPCEASRKIFAAFVGHCSL